MTNNILVPSACRLVAGRRHSLTFLALAVTASALLAGCTSEVQPEGMQTAQLDIDAQVVIWPLDRFVMSDRDARMVNAANAVLIDDCMRPLGHENPSAKVDWQSIPPTHTRLFGPWNLQWVAEHGYDYPTDPRMAALGEDLDATSAQWTEAYVECQQKVPQFAQVTLHGDNNIALQGWFESYAEAENRPDWAEVVNEWVACLSAAGHQVPEEGWVPDLPSEKEAEIRVAIADVVCKEQVGLILRLSNILAEEQMEFIDANRSALEELRSLRDEILTQAEAVLAQSS